MSFNNMSIEDISSKVVLSVMNYEANKDLLEKEEFPYLTRGEFALYASFCFIENEVEKMDVFTNDMLRTYGMDQKDLFEFAIDNSRKLFPATIKPLSELAQFERDNMIPDGVAVPEVYMITNERFFNGAAAMFYQPELLEKMIDETENSNVVILATGPNEIFCVSAEHKEELLEYRDLLHEILESQSQDVALSNNVLCYDGESKRIYDENENSFSPFIEEEFMSRNINLSHRR